MPTHPGLQAAKYRLHPICPACACDLPFPSGSINAGLVESRCGCGVTSIAVFIGTEPSVDEAVKREQGLREEMWRILSSPPRDYGEQ